MSDFTPFIESNQLYAASEPVTGPDAADRDLTSYKQSYKKNRYVVFIDKMTGQIFTLDTVKARYDRMRKRVKAWADVLGDIPNARLIMVGLTYKPSECYKPNDIRDFMSKVKRKLGNGLLGYSWVSELQNRGAIHYHVCMYLKKGTRFPLPDKAGWWSHGSSNVITAKSPYYMLSYTKKKYQKDYEKFPDGCRAYAVWIQSDVMAEKLRYLSLKAWEKGIVDSDGWQELPFYRQLHKDCNPWLMHGYYSDIDEAEKQTDYWLGLFTEVSEWLQPKIE
jgi:hypothetical protein